MLIYKRAMANNYNNSNSRSNWVLDMTMRSQLPSWEPSLDSLLYEPVYPQKNQAYSSNPRANSIFIDDRVEIQGGGGEEEEEQGLGPMKETMYKIAVMQPVEIDPAMIRKPRRRNIRISDDPQSIAARQRRERISERIRILQRLVPGGTKMDTASMLDEAIHYVKFLKKQVQELQTNRYHPGVGVGHLVANNWAMAVGPISQEFGFMQGAGSTSMGAHVTGWFE